MATSHALDRFNASPHILQALPNSMANKPLAPALHISPIANPLGPMKEWTIPPRPKPGRKPALDAPPTKRKAQNREAQRAFRERRAAKVGELEEHMKRMEEGDAREQDEMRREINDLQAEVEKWRSISGGWREEYEKVQSLLDRERQSKQQREMSSQSSRQDTAESTDAVPLRPRTRRHDKLGNDYHEGVTENNEGLDHITCGRCSNESRCQCVEDAFELGDISVGMTENNSVKRPLSRQNQTGKGKRARLLEESTNESQEIDFTSPRIPAPPNIANSSTDPAISAPLDSCGFCQDGTACICAEIDRQNENEPVIAEKAITSSRANNDPTSSSCTNNPGTCTQCQAIPESKSFCTSLAASRALDSETNGGKTVPSPATVATLNCADAFKRLAQHPNFPQASTQLNTWVPQLATRAELVSSSLHNDNLVGRTAFEIEAASVMNVFKSFDVRFGENTSKTKDNQQI